MKSIVAAIAALAVVAVSAQEVIVSITSPLEGTVYTAGKDATISWINPTVDKISKIVLAKGAATLLQPVADVATDVDASLGTYKWTIPADTAPGDDYAFELGTSPNIAYTGHFKIQAADGSAANSTSPSASASSGSSASASASSKPSASAGASGSASGSTKSSPSSTGSSSAAEESTDESAGVKLTAGPVALALVGAAAVGLL